MTRPLGGLTLLVALLGNYATAKTSRFVLTSQSQYCVAGCDTTLSLVKFTDPTAQQSSSNTAIPKCSNRLRTRSLFYCAATYCSEHDIQEGLKAQNRSCVEQAGILLPSYTTLMQDVGSQELGMVMTFAAPGMKTPFTEPAIPGPALWRRGVGTMGSLSDNGILARDLGYGFYGFWGLVVILGTLYRLFHLFQKARPDPKLPQTMLETEIDSKAKPGPLTRKMRQHLLLPAAFNGKYQEPIGKVGSLPSRMESLTILLYLILNFVYMFPGYHEFDGHLFWPQRSLQLAHAVSDRSGILTIMNLPIVWVTAARNDPFLWLTGWSYATFHRFHRWIGRLVFVLAIVHSATYTVAAKQGMEYSALFAEAFWNWGIAAIVLMSVIVGSSAYCFRKTLYDAWLIIHIVFAAVFLGAVFCHIDIWNGFYNGYIWACVAMWGLDRVARAARIAFHLWHGRSIDAFATYNAEADIVRLDVTKHFPIDKEPAPGQYYFIYQPRTLRGWESHPFSLSTWLNENPATSDRCSGSQERNEKHFAQPRRVLEADGRTDWHHSFIIRPQTGFTQRLRDHVVARQGPSEDCKISLLIEGPYGAKHRFRRYAAVTMIAGGSGISAIVSHASELLKRSTTVHIVWVVRRRSFAEAICGEEFRAVLGNSRYTVDVYLSDENETKEGSAENSDSEHSSGYNLLRGRPDIQQLLSQDRIKSPGNLAVVCCGPAKLADETRRVVVQLVGESGNEIAYHDHTFGW